MMNGRKYLAFYSAQRFIFLHIYIHNIYIRVYICLDGAGTCELVGLFLLQKLKPFKLL